MLCLMCSRGSFLLSDPCWEPQELQILIPYPGRGFKQGRTTIAWKKCEQVGALNLQEIKVTAEIMQLSCQLCAGHSHRGKPQHVSEQPHNAPSLPSGQRQTDLTFNTSCTVLGVPGHSDHVSFSGFIFFYLFFNALLYFVEVKALSLPREVQQKSGFSEFWSRRYAGQG